MKKTFTKNNNLMTFFNMRVIFSCIQETDVCSISLSQRSSSFSLIHIPDPLLECNHNSAYFFEQIVTFQTIIYTDSKHTCVIFVYDKHGMNWTPHEGYVGYINMKYYHRYLDEWASD